MGQGGLNEEGGDGDGTAAGNVICWRLLATQWALMHGVLWSGRVQVGSTDFLNLPMAEKERKYDVPTVAIGRMCATFLFRWGSPHPHPPAGSSSC